MKTCARCKEQKPLEQFNRKTETQLQSFCKPCNKEYQREHYLSNKEMYALKRDKWKKEYTPPKKPKKNKGGKVTKNKK